MHKQSELECVALSLPDEGMQFQAQKGANLLEVLRAQGVRVPAVCGGRGTCGKCKVQVNGTEQLACRTTVEENAEIRLVAADDFDILTDYSLHRSSDAPTRQGYAIAVDIGTTTVALQLLNRETGLVAAQTSFVNAQRRYGADVISRIKAADEGQLDTLHTLITKDLLAAFLRLCQTAGIAPEIVQQIQIAGNTTMLYLLLGYTCTSLGQYPFIPEHAWKEQYTFHEIFQSEAMSCPVELVPWISAFVGGDITAGLLYCTQQEVERFLLVDIGTNGEMALYTGNEVLCTSTAAGPAFEGGNIRHGMGGVRGAIGAVELVDGKLVSHTIGNVPPIGICGSGVLDTGACLLAGEFMDESGLLEDSWFETGVELASSRDGKPIVFTQQDVRELQLAKSAIRAGIEILMQDAGGYDSVDRVYLSGGFGKHMRVSSAVAIGMLPEELGEKTVPCGNSSLGGSVLLCMDPRQKENLLKWKEQAKEINLSSDSRFNELFMEYMMFE